MLLLNQPRKKPQTPAGSGVKLQDVAPRQDTPEAPARAAPVEACFQPRTCTLLFLTIIYVSGERAAFARQVLFVVVVVGRQEMKVWCCFDVILDCCLLE